MPVKYSLGPIEYSTSVRSDTAVHMIADLDAVLNPCALSRTSVTGGWKYTMQSPDGLQMKIWVQNLGDGSGTYLRVTPTSEDESRVGTLGLLNLNGETYEAWANCCQFFTAEYGVANQHNNFACGIPALPSGSGPCTVGGSAPDVTELWWSSAAVNPTFVSGILSFRVSRYDNGNWALSYNGTLVDTTSLLLNMMPLCEAYNVDYAYGNPSYLERYTTGNGLNIDTLISVGPQIYGQMWDAFTYTLPFTLDAQETLTDTDSNGNPFSVTFFAWNYNVPGSPTAGVGTILATLMLLAGPSPSTNLLQNWSY